MRFRLVEELEESVNQNTKSRLCKALGLNVEDGYVLHHLHNEKYIKDDEQHVANYKNIDNCVLIPFDESDTSLGNDLHHLVHYLAKHKSKLRKKIALGIENGKAVKYSIYELVKILEANI